VFAHPERPLEVDVGFAHGTFLLEQAAQRPEHNFVGLEIRVPMVEEVRERITKRALTNVVAVLCNANQSFRDLFAPDSLHRVHVHFPDPWFKKRHHKRRLVNQAFLDDLARCLVEGGELRFMTDFKDYADEVIELVEAHPAFVNAHGPGQPAPPEDGRVLSLREEWHLSQGDPVHRYHWRHEPPA
jgi:tRNA (guanine-N7-)-methyltransferase